MRLICLLLCGVFFGTYGQLVETSSTAHTWTCWNPCPVWPIPPSTTPSEVPDPTTPAPTHQPGTIWTCWQPCIEVWSSCPWPFPSSGAPVEANRRTRESRTTRRQRSTRPTVTRTPETSPWNPVTGPTSSVPATWTCWNPCPIWPLPSSTTPSDVTQPPATTEAPPSPGTIWTCWQPCIEVWSSSPWPFPPSSEKPSTDVAIPTTANPSPEPWIPVTGPTSSVRATWTCWNPCAIWPLPSSTTPSDVTQPTTTISTPKPGTLWTCWEPCVEVWSSSPWPFPPSSAVPRGMRSRLQV